jgi:hypothetical protein
MLDTARMTQGDARHTLLVYQWIVEHLQEITAIAQTPERACVAASEAQAEFHEIYTELESTRLLPVRIAMFTDEDTLERGGRAEPNVLLHRPLNETQWAVVGWLHTKNLSEVAGLFGISGDERTWQVTRDERRRRGNYQYSAIHQALAPTLRAGLEGTQ